MFTSTSSPHSSPGPRALQMSQTIESKHPVLTAQLNTNTMLTSQVIDSPSESASLPAVFKVRDPALTSKWHRFKVQNEIFWFLKMKQVALPPLHQ